MEKNNETKNTTNVENTSNVNQVNEKQTKSSNGKKVIAGIACVIVTAGVITGVVLNKDKIFKNKENNSNNTSNSVVSEETKQNEDADKKENAEQEKNENSVVNVDINVVDREEQYIIITAYDKDNKEVWKYETEKQLNEQFSDLEKIGIFENKVYINEFGTIHVLDKQTGKTVWKNSEYKGCASQFDFGLDGTLYLTAFNGPDLFIVDSNGKTLKKYTEFRKLGMLGDFNLNNANEELVLTYYDQTYAATREAIVYVDLTDYSYEIDKSNPEVNFKYDENGFIIITDYSNIAISTFEGIWETNPEDTQIAINSNNRFIMDHYTKSSEVSGTWTCENDKIELKCDNGKTYSGQLLVQKDEKSLVLKINIDGKDTVFYWREHNAG